MINLSVNVNKIATLRNSRGGHTPSVIHFVKLAIDCGVQGITIHPRPDERHITFADVFEIKKHLSGNIEFNIEGYPDERFLSIIDQARPHQATLVPDGPDVVTSDQGWNVKDNFQFLIKIITRLKKLNVRVSLFMDPDFDQIKLAKVAGADRIEFYTGPFAESFKEGLEKAEKSFVQFNEAAIYADSLGLEINAGHDLNSKNLTMFKYLHGLKEVSIGHAIISESLECGWKNVIQEYLHLLE